MKIRTYLHTVHMRPMWRRTLASGHVIIQSPMRTECTVPANLSSPVPLNTDMIPTAAGVGCDLRLIKLMCEMARFRVVSVEELRHMQSWHTATTVSTFCMLSCTVSHERR